MGYAKTATITGPTPALSEDDILKKLKNVKKLKDGQHIACCPAHDDNRQSLSVTTGDDGKVLLNCFAGCTTAKIVDELGIELRQLFPPEPESVRSNGAGTASRNVRTYDYLDEHGSLLFQAVRKEPKGFLQCRTDGKGGYIWDLKGVRLVPYNLPSIVASPVNATIDIFEGEKDCDRAASEFGLIATTNPMGAGKWRPEFSQMIAPRPVRVYADNDAPGRLHAQQVAAACHAAGSSVKIVELPGLEDKGDFSDWIDAGGTLDQLKQIVAKTTVWQPTAGILTALLTPKPIVIEEPWPVLHEAALHGLAGEIVRVIEPTTEADHVAVLATFLVYFGNMVGRSPHVMVGDDRHGTNLFAALVGETGEGRKGTSDGSNHRLIAYADEAWARDRKQGGLSTGEGLIHAIRDPRSETNKKGEEVIVDPGETDKRLMCLEEELAFCLKVIARQGNTLSEIMRRAWDSRGVLRTMTKLSPSKATNPHVSILAHITKAELARHVSETELANGLLNRYLWFVVKRSKYLPEPKRMSDNAAGALGRQIRDAKAFAVRAGELSHDDEAREVWATIYRDLATGKPGLAGAMTARAAPIVRRLSMIYALLDSSKVVTRVHLQAALAIWDYSAASVQMIFGDLTGDPVADRIISVLRRSGEMTQSDVSEVFGRNVPATRLSQALEVLLNAGQVMVWQEAPETGRGRPRTLWKAFA